MHGEVQKGITFLFLVFLDRYWGSWWWTKNNFVALSLNVVGIPDDRQRHRKKCRQAAGWKKVAGAGKIRVKNKMYNSLSRRYINHGLKIAAMCNPYIMNLVNILHGFLKMS